MRRGFTVIIIVTCRFDRKSGANVPSRASRPSPGFTSTGWTTTGESLDNELHRHSARKKLLNQTKASGGFDARARPPHQTQHRESVSRGCPAQLQPKPVATSLVSPNSLFVGSSLCNPQHAMHSSVHSDLAEPQGAEPTSAQAILGRGNRERDARLMQPLHQRVAHAGCGREDATRGARQLRLVKRDAQGSLGHLHTAHGVTWSTDPHLLQGSDVPSVQ